MSYHQLQEVTKFKLKEGNLFITFTKGKYKSKTFQGTFVICSNPVCNCSKITLNFTNINNNKAINNKNTFTIDIDIIKNELIFDKNDNRTASDYKFGKSFINEIDEFRWEELYNYYYSYKTYITEKSNLDELEPVFNSDEIENEQLMVAYRDILPFSRNLLFKIDNIEYLIDDQYCVYPKCNCSNGILTFIPFKNKNQIFLDTLPTIWYNYKNKKWEIEKKSSKDLHSIERITQELLDEFPDLNKTLKMHHEQLRILYKNYRKKHGISSKIAVKEKIGRNEPCRCGSGKKYKKCCGR